MKTGSCKYKTYRENEKHKHCHNQRGNSASSKSTDLNPEELSEEQELEQVAYDEVDQMQSNFLQMNLDRVEAILHDLNNTLDGEVNSWNI